MNHLELQSSLQKTYKNYQIIICCVFLFLTFNVISSNAQTKFKVLNYLYNISGKYTIAGQQGSGFVDDVGQVAGKYAGLWGEDFTFVIDGEFGGGSITESRRRMIEEAKKRWDEGYIISLMFHACPPLQAEPCSWYDDVLSTLTDEQWTQLITPGTTMYNNWLARLDKIAVGLQELEDNNIEVLFRPFHEMNQGAFWWGGRPGTNGTAKIYQITHDYLTNVKGLTNLIWVWNLQDFSTLASDVNTYDPGSDYYDLLTLDVYWSDGTGLTDTKYNLIKNKAAGKPIGLGELDALPSPSVLASQPKWTYFMAWRELTQQKNTDSYIRQVYNATNVVTLDEMPGWDNYCYYGDAPNKITGIVEAENYNNCGEGISYHDTDTINTGSKYRTEEGVDIDTLNEGGYYVKDIQAGEWLTYTVEADTAGQYKIGIRISCTESGKTFHIEMNGENISGNISIPNTGGEQNWETINVTTPVITTGFKTIKVVMEGGGFNLDKLTFTMANKAPTVKITSPTGTEAYKTPIDITITTEAEDEDGKIEKVEFYDGEEKIGESTSSPYSYEWKEVPAGEHTLKAKATDDGGLTGESEIVSFKVTQTQGPYLNEAFEIPGRVEMENYDIGGQDISYNDLTEGNKFNLYRYEDVDIEECTDTTGGYLLADFQANEWVEYSLNVTKSGKYDVELRVATQSTSAKISIIIGARSITGGNLAIESTGGWQVWKSIVIEGVQLTAGKTIMRVTCGMEYPNINYIEFKESATSGVEEDDKPEEFKLNQNYPNPFNPVTEIKYTIAEMSKVTLKVYDMLGREVETLVNEEKAAEEYTVEFNGKELSSGIYIYRLTAGEFIQTKQMILLK